MRVSAKMVESLVMMFTASESSKNGSLSLADNTSSVCRMQLMYLFLTKDCPEYVVPWQEFTNLFTEAGFELVVKKSFDKMHKDGIKDVQSKELFQRMMKKSVDDELMRPNLWEVCTFYMAVVLRKK
eukprot:NODE_7_length_48057_cov_0.322240.p28 type:complete len:126 gc:universal NODE_7_length_48057_cov_0.322240:20362-19985(-)